MFEWPKIPIRVVEETAENDRREAGDLWDVKGKFTAGGYFFPPFQSVCILPHPGLAHMGLSIPIYLHYKTL